MKLLSRNEGKKEIEKKNEAESKKAKAAIAKESWLLEREQAMKEAEIEDLNAGRIRLADLEDSDDNFGGRKNKKKGKISKKNKGDLLNKL